MRRRPARWVETGRITSGQLASRNADGCNGCFVIGALRIIGSDGDGWKDSGMELPAWEHVSVSLATRCPTWDELSQVKDAFWEPEELVIQLHPRKSQYVNCHPYTLHMWRPIGVELPEPPTMTVGPR